MVETNKFYALENLVQRLQGQINALGVEISKLRRSITHPVTIGYINKRLSNFGDLLGTVNQVVVIGGTGAVAKADDVTLSLPQDIDTGATPEFAELMLGTSAPIAGATLEVNVTDWSLSASFGDPTDGQSDNIYVVGNTINGLYGYDSDNCSIWLNYRGYHGGTTKFRDLYIGDGKQNPLVFVQASTHRVMVGHGGTPAHTLHVKEDGNCGIAVASNDADGEPYIAWYQTTTQRAYIQYNDQGVNPDYLEIQSDGHIRLNPTNNINITSLPIYANNAAAIVGGLVAGDLYRTNGDPDPVCIVH